MVVMPIGLPFSVGLMPLRQSEKLWESLSTAKLSKLSLGSVAKCHWQETEKIVREGMDGCPLRRDCPYNFFTSSSFRRLRFHRGVIARPWP